MKDDQYLIHAYGRHQVVLDHGEGVYLYDKEGHKYLDFYAGIGVNALGYNYPKYIKRLEEQLSKVTHVSNYFYTEPLLEAAKKIAAATKLDQTFFTNSGAEAVEGALKLARKYYYLKHHEANSEIIAFHHSFHGRTTGALKLTANPHYQEAFGPLMNGVKYATLNDIQSVQALITDHTCAIIVEPVQGEGGLHPCDQGFLRELRKICDARDICLIIDEIQSGMGRTGTIMTYFQYGIMPDILCLAKALGCGVPVGAFVANKKYGNAMAPGDHGSTYGGNPFVCAAVSAVFDIFKEDHIVENVRQLTPYLESKLDELAQASLHVIGHRGLGFMQGIVLDNDQAGDYAAKILADGVIVITAGANVIRLLPPLISTKENIDEAFAVIQKNLQ